MQCLQSHLAKLVGTAVGVDNAPQTKEPRSERLSGQQAQTVDHVGLKGFQDLGFYIPNRRVSEKRSQIAKLSSETIEEKSQAGE